MDSLYKRFFIIDAFAYIFRSYYAIKHIDHNAVYGFTNTLKKIIDNEKPEYIAVSFDSIEPTFRNEIYKEYKANRQEPPEDLRPQIPLVKEVVSAFNIPLIEVSGYESDDIIGTLAHHAQKENVQVVIITGDKDMLQLVKGNDVVVFDPGRTAQYLEEKDIPQHFGCRPDQIIDLLTIWGDSSDNIPGIPGIGEKGAKKLLAEYDSLDGIYENLDKITRKSYREGLENSREKIPLLRELVTICRDVPIEYSLDRFKFKGIDNARCQELFAKLNFKRLLNEIPIELEECKQDYPIIDDENKLRALCEKLEQQKLFVFDVETDSLEPLDANIVGMSFCTAKNDACYVPIAHIHQQKSWQELATKYLQPIFANKSIKKGAHNIKYDYSVLINNGWQCENIYFDTMILSYLLEPNENRHGLDHLAEKMLKYQTISYESICGKGKKQISFAEADLEKAKQYASEDADICWQLYEILRDQVQEKNVQEVCEKIELPLLNVLSEMEQCGIRVDCDLLKNMSQKMQKQIETLEKEIYDLAGQEFNIKSTQQLGYILFEKLQIPPLKKTSKTKSYSTGHDVLEKLANQGHALPAKLLNYRELTKLKSTYVDALPKLVHPKTSRVHTSFNQVVAATGRLSSTNPNLQNIPIRTEMGKEIRAAFIPAENQILISADYSQIELRIMAHYCEDETLVSAFKNGEDIHLRTASEVFDIPIETVPAELRRAAKSINFGLLYGMGDFRLAQELNISRKEARNYIASYFEKMPRIQTFCDEIIEKAKEAGHVRTYFGRLRQIPEINSRNKTRQKQGERLAVNTIIQGTAADIIKLAMIKLQQNIHTNNLKANLLLQVHDELVLECPKQEQENIISILKESMENIVSLKVPLTVEAHSANNWKDAK
ncbi:DNA polymerase I [Candidatus Uabimicrobium sp. HlEnr_7]|uniref:DNA polymerase I n=1 Tax=Candidatus Uabimicrobium helgolandensis TaxID=3095367 RepID=UPI003558927E